jgi:hypothetical protein
MWLAMRNEHGITLFEGAHADLRRIPGNSVSPGVLTTDVDTMIT